MYKLMKPDLMDGVVKVIERLSDNTFIPINPDNTDYQAYLKWIELGGVPLPADNEGTV